MTETSTTPTVDTPEYRQQLFAGPQKIALLVGVAGTILFVVMGLVVAMTTSDDAVKDHEAPAPIQQIMLSYLTGFSVWVSIGIGSVFFLLIQYVTGGRWGILLRRPLEAGSKTLLIALVFFFPIAVSMFSGKDSIYWWARHAAHHDDEHATEGGAAAPGGPGAMKDAAEKEGGDPVAVRKVGTPEAKTASHGKDWKQSNVRPELQHDEEKKIHDWLWPSFTAIRGYVYLLIFIGLAYWMWTNAKRAENDPDLAVAAKYRDRQKYVGSAGLFVFAITLTLAATDGWMSLEEAFASSMFPVITFDNAAVTAYCVGLLTLLYIKAKGDSRFVHLFPSTEQVHLGSLLLAFTLAWTYFNFSQYMLIWVGNLAEEIPYYIKRTSQGWEYYAIGAVIFHFPIPFLLLLFRRVKSNPTALRNIAIMLLCVCFLDVMWWIQPSHSHWSAPKFYWLIDVGAWLMVGGFWVAYFLSHMKRHPLLPTREVYLLEEYHHGH